MAPVYRLTTLVTSGYSGCTGASNGWYLGASSGVKLWTAYGGYSEHGEQWGGEGCVAVLGDEGRDGGVLGG